MRSAVRPSIRRVGTRSMNPMSSSMPTQDALWSWGMILPENWGSLGRSMQTLFEHDLFRKAVATFRDHTLRHQLVAARVGHQDGRVGGVPLDLLAQPVDVGFERMGGDARVVAPDLLQQCLARHRALAGAVEIAQDRGLLLGQADLAALGADEQFGAWPERVGPDGEDRVLACLVLSQLGADARQQHGKAKRLRDVVRSEERRVGKEGRTRR